MANNKVAGLLKKEIGNENETEENIDDEKTESVKGLVYHKMLDTDGQKYFYKSWSLVLSLKDNAKIESDRHNGLRHRSFFDLFGRATSKPGIYLHLTKKEFDTLNLDKLPEKIYLYGAYNQTSVVTIRCYGSIRKMTNSEKKEFALLIQERLSGETSYDKLFHELSDKQVRNARSLIKEGNYYFFEPESFAYHNTDR